MPVSRIATSLQKSVATRMYAVVALGLLAVLAVAIFALQFADRIKFGTLEIQQQGVPGVLVAGELEVLLERHRATIEAAFRDLGRPQLALRRRAGDELAGQIALKAEEVRDAVGMGVADEVALLIAQGRRVLMPERAEDRDQAEQALSGYLSIAAHLQEQIERYRSERLALTERSVARLAADAARLASWVVGAALFLMFVVAPSSVVVVGSVADRLRRLSACMLRLAGNETTVAVPALRDPDEVGDMARAVTVFKANAIALLAHKEKAEQLNRWLEIAFENMSRGLSMFDSRQRLLVCNRIYRDMYHLTDALTRPGTPFEDIMRHRIRVGTGREGEVDSGDPSRWAPARRADAAGDKFMTLTHRLADGRVISVAFQPLPDGGWVAVHEDITEKKLADDRVARLARQDPLTDVANRLHFREEIERSFRKLAKTKALPSIGSISIASRRSTTSTAIRRAMRC